MTEQEIDRKFEQQDKDFKAYVDMKFRSLKKTLAVFLWIEKNPWKSIIALVLFLMLLVFLANIIDFRKTAENKTGIELKSE